MERGYEQGSRAPRTGGRTSPGRVVLFLLRPLFGLGVLWIFNLIVSSFGVALGLNTINACIVGYLGLPGLATLLFLKVFFSG